MKAKYITEGGNVYKETYDHPESKFPFDKTIIYVAGGNYNSRDICEMLQAAYDRGAQHALEELRYKFDEIKGAFK